MDNEQLIRHFRVVDELVEDLSDRCGLKQEWSEIDEEIKDEVRLKWAQILHRAYGACSLIPDR